MDAIVAAYEDWGIGAEGTQPVALSADRRYFREKNPKCLGHCGTENLEIFPGPPPAQPGWFSPHPGKSGNSRPGLSTAREIPCSCLPVRKRFFVIGGASVYGAICCPSAPGFMSPRWGACPPSDVFFPNLDQDPDWVCADAGPQCWEEGISYRFCIHPVLTSVFDSNFLIFHFLWHAPSGQTGICGI